MEKKCCIHFFGGIATVLLIRRVRVSLFLSFVNNIKVMTFLPELPENNTFSLINDSMYKERIQVSGKLEKLTMKTLTLSHLDNSKL